MANSEHIKIIRKGVDYWNKWREDNPYPYSTAPNLEGADLSNLDLQKINFIGTNLSKANLFCSILVGANFTNADVSEANLRNAFLSGATLIMANFRQTDLIMASMNEVIGEMVSFMGAQLRGAELINSRLSGATLLRADLEGANFSGSNLNNANLSFASLAESNFSNTDLTGINLYASIRESWIINEAKCDYIFNDKKWKHRIPQTTKFDKGEFEKLYKKLPTFEYIFKKGFSPIDTFIMNRIVQAINEKQPEIELQLDSFQSRGKPRAIFTVLHKQSIEKVSAEITNEYERKIALLEGKNESLLEIISAYIDKPQYIINGKVNINAIDISGGTNLNNIGSTIYKQKIKEINQ